MNAAILPDRLTYCFAPVEDAETGLHRIHIVVEGLDIAIGTSLAVLVSGEAMALADRFNRPLGWTRARWTAFAAERLHTGGAEPGGRAPE